ncbi:hypothetical protein PTKIN_Ptkin17bG0137300 [Pterospermum kingtungense]
MLSCGMDKFPTSYLGLPLGIKVNSTEVWDPIIRKMEQRLSRWKVDRLIMSERVVLIKSTLASLPTYFMSLFPIPAAVKRHLDRFPIGNGAQILFWSQEWIDGIILKICFPRIYALAISKEGKVCHYFEDELVWKGHSSGIYSAKSFCFNMAKSNGYVSKQWILIWSRLLPPKVEVSTGKYSMARWQSRRNWYLDMPFEIMIWNILYMTLRWNWFAICSFCVSFHEEFGHPGLLIGV